MFKIRTLHFRLESEWEELLRQALRQGYKATTKNDHVAGPAALAWPPTRQSPLTDVTFEKRFSRFSMSWYVRFLTVGGHSTPRDIKLCFRLWAKILLWMFFDRRKLLTCL